jgi:hypothetical protein
MIQKALRAKPQKQALNFREAKRQRQRQRQAINLAM